MIYTINGDEWVRVHNFCFRYEEIIEAAGYPPSRVLTVTWAKPDGRCGTLGPDQDIMITDGTIIKVAATSATQAMCPECGRPKAISWAEWEDSFAAAAEAGTYSLCGAEHETSDYYPDERAVLDCNHITITRFKARLAQAMAVVEAARPCCGLGSRAPDVAARERLCSALRDFDAKEKP